MLFSRRSRRLICRTMTALICLLLALSSVATASVVVIGSKDIKADQLSLAQINNIYLARNMIVDSQTLTPIDQASNSKIYNEFYQLTAKWSVDQVSQYWANQVFTGRGSQPQSVSSDQAAIERVLAGNLLIAYIDSQSLIEAKVGGKVKLLYGTAEGWDKAPEKHKGVNQGISSGGSFGLKSSSVKASTFKPGSRSSVAPSISSNPSPRAARTVTLPYSQTIWSQMASSFRMQDKSIDTDVKKQINWYMQHKSTLESMLTNSIPYIGYISQSLRAQNIPQEYALLPIIESGYNPFAYSSAGATGLWQMMPQTATLYGLNISWWYDARRDILISTKAAVKYLGDLHREFSDWSLVAAAYNAGSGTISKAIEYNKKAGKPISYSELPLPTETKAYLPKLLALADIIRNASEYGVTLPSIPITPYFTSVTLKAQMDLSQISKLSGISENLIHYLNPGMRRFATSSEGSYTLLLPNDVINTFQSNLKKIVGTTHISWQYHEVWAGESLSKIARDNHTKVSLLRKVNNMPTGNVKQGDGLLVPVNLNAKYEMPLSIGSSKQVATVDDISADDILSGKIANINVAPTPSVDVTELIPKGAKKPTSDYSSPSKSDKTIKEVDDPLVTLFIQFLNYIRAFRL